MSFVKVNEMRSYVEFEFDKVRLTQKAVMDNVKFQVTEMEERMKKYVEKQVSEIYPRYVEL